MKGSDTRYGYGTAKDTSFTVMARSEAVNISHDSSLITSSKQDEVGDAENASATADAKAPKDIDENTAILPGVNLSSSSRDGEGAVKRLNKLDTLSSKTPISPGTRIVPGKKLARKTATVVQMKDIDFETRLQSPRKGPSHLIDVDSLPVRSNTAPVNLQLFDFSRIKHLCNGSNSNIFKADYKGEAVILKYAADSYFVSETVRSEFKNEQGLLLRLSHTNMIHCYGCGMIDEDGIYALKPFLVLQRLDGGTLAFQLSKKRPINVRPFTFKRFLEIAKSLADVMAYMHYGYNDLCMILHRDLKPDNLGFMADGTLKVIDLGLCTCIRRNCMDNATYQLTGMTGSLRYMAPEVAKCKPYNEKVDVYSLGLIMYEMVTGVAPFSGMRKNDFLKRVVQENKRPPLEADDFSRPIEVPQRLKDTMASCWSPDYTERPTMTELHKVLEQLEMEERARLGRMGLLFRSMRCFSNPDSI